MCKIGLLTSVFLDSGTCMLEKGNMDRLKDENQRQVYTTECRQWGSGSAQGNRRAPGPEQKRSSILEGLQAHTEQLHSHCVVQELINHSYEMSSSTLVVLHGAQQFD